MYVYINVYKRTDTILFPCYTINGSCFYVLIIFWLKFDDYKKMKSDNITPISVNMSQGIIMK
jgi:hypothetical protein